MQLICVRRTILILSALKFRDIASIGRCTKLAEMHTIVHVGRRISIIQVRKCHLLSYCIDLRHETQTLIDTSQI